MRFEFRPDRENNGNEEERQIQRISRWKRGCKQKARASSGVAFECFFSFLSVPPQLLSLLSSHLGSRLADANELVGLHRRVGERDELRVDADGRELFVGWCWRLRSRGEREDVVRGKAK